MLSWLFWNFNHKRFNVLANFWRWNHTKTMHQIIVINFSKLLSNYRIFWRQDSLFFVLFIIFLYFVFSSDSFFSWFYNTSNCKNPDFHNFSPTYLKFITKKKPSQNLKNRIILILEFKNRIRNFKNTMK